MPTDDARARTRVEPIYHPRGEAGEIIAYAGDLAIDPGESKRVVTGQLELRLFPRADFIAHFAAPPQ